MLTVVIVALQVLDQEGDGVLGLADQELLQHGLWAQGRQSTEPTGAWSPRLLDMGLPSPSHRAKQAFKLGPGRCPSWHLLESP